MGLFGRDSQTNRPQQGQVNRTSSPSSPSPGSTTTIGEGTKISGEIHGSTEIRIEGEFEGSIAISGIVFVGGTGKVKASVHAATVNVAGRVDGDIFGDQIIELEPSAVVTGNLLAPKILIREGASLQGRVEMASPAPKTSSAKNSQGKEKTGKGQTKKPLKDDGDKGQPGGAGTKK